MGETGGWLTTIYLKHDPFTWEYPAGELGLQSSSSRNIARRTSLPPLFRGRKTRPGAFACGRKTRPSKPCHGLSTFLAELVVFGIGKVEILQYYLIPMLPGKVEMLQYYLTACRAFVTRLRAEKSKYHNTIPRHAAPFKWKLE
jgi:hypothetical protein